MIILICSLLGGLDISSAFWLGIVTLAPTQHIVILAGGLNYPIKNPSSDRPDEKLALLLKNVDGTSKLEELVGQLGGA